MLKPSHRTLVVLGVLALGCALIAMAELAAPPTTGPSTRPAKEISIDLDRAVAIVMPEVKENLKAVEFTTPDKRKGWAVRFEGNRPIATPAYADGKLFVGGGYGSHEFYCLDAMSGKVIWQIKTADDGP